MNEKYIPLKILNENEKKEIEKNLNKNFGIEKVPGIILRRGEERLFLFQGFLTEKEIKLIEFHIPVERVGIYFAKILNDEIKLSIEGSQILKDQIKNNIFEISQKDEEEWMMGRDLLIQTGKKGLLIMKSKNDFLGCGKASENKIGNFIPKNRRLKEKTIK